ncbi:MAG: hypothetical protein LBT53_03570, partial [Puniceicoccales bacterium]|nr:hypothetical protein [Puniceicoccales bacterium]
VPFLENTEFRKLEVVCDHRPRWLNEEMARLSLLVEETPLSDGGALLVIVPVPGVVRRIGSNRHASGSRYKHCGCGG